MRVILTTYKSWDGPPSVQSPPPGDDVCHLSRPDRKDWESHGDPKDVGCDEATHGAVHGVDCLDDQEPQKCSPQHGVLGR